MFRAISVAIILILGSTAQDTSSKQDPGAVILLSLKPPAESVPILASALTDPDPAVRVAAARVAAVNDARSLTGKLAAVLAVEQHEMAGAEQVRALFLLEGQAALTTVDAHVARLGGAAALVMAQWLAQNQPEDFAKRLPRLAASIPPDRGSLVPIVAHAARQAGLQQEVLSAWMDVARPAEWKPVLQQTLIEADDFKSSSGILIESLGSSRPHVREDSVWFLVSTLGRGTSVPAEVVEVALPQGAPGDTVDWETLGRELIARKATKGAHPDRSEFLKTQRSHRRLSDPLILPLLTEREAALVRTAFPVSSRASTGTGTATPGLGQIEVRTVSEWLPGVVAMTSAAAGCRIPASPRFGFARVTYDDRGRAARTAVDTRDLPKECHAVLAALARTGLADPDRPLEDGQQQWQVLPLSQSFAECTSRPATASLPVGGEVGGDLIKPPRKVKDVRPDYPEDVRQRRGEGTVFVEAVIADTGCVRALRLVRSSGELGLDLAAIRAVTGWIFDPAIVGGKPVAVHMTVTVSFTLR